MTIRQPLLSPIAAKSETFTTLKLVLSNLEFFVFNKTLLCKKKFIAAKQINIQIGERRTFLAMRNPHGYYTACNSQEMGGGTRKNFGFRKGTSKKIEKQTFRNQNF